MIPIELLRYNSYNSTNLELTRIVTVISNPNEICVSLVGLLAYITSVAKRAKSIYITHHISTNTLYLYLH